MICNKKAGLVPGDSRGWATFCPKLGKGQLGDATYQGSRPCGFRDEDFSCFHYISLCKTCDPLTGPFLAPGA